ncbi:MAG: arylamine N-acetyltransferase [Marivita sp.]|uniref:arylamine N-acetyltransferase family protein n=1 Tax=Marivita sp. TaxID=2003365 RepID=UPI0025C44D90|nr:arylamine N-acetyltransferase [Marivita sp.]MCI5111938.1 arylamine N-acetyltransferase [Marivita sp.]
MRDAWLSRLGLPSDLPVTLDSLTTITRAHLDRIPFENLTVFCGDVPELDSDALTAKILHQRRGGYCVELNPLLCAGLRALGFDARLRMARVLWQRDVPGPRSHCLCLVTLEGREYLVDVGFGGPGPTGPHLLGSETENLRTEARQALGTVLSRQVAEGNWRDLYAFTDEVTTMSDVQVGNWLAATLPGSLFTRSLIVTRHIDDTRLVLEGGTFRRFAKGRAPEAEVLQTPSDLIACLQDTFAIDPPPGLERALIDKGLF